MGDEARRAASFGGLEVAAFESRRAKETAALISNYGGIPRVGPSMREVPLEENVAAFDFAEKLLGGKLDGVIFMTGVGTRTLLDTLATRYPVSEIVRGLSKVTIIARGPKPVAVLREFQVPVTIMVPEPNTWREILQELDENPRGFTLDGSRVAIQEYGVPNEKLIQELTGRGAKVLRVPVYRWALPEDLAPLLESLRAILEGRARVVLFTNAAQVEHVLRVASEKGFKERLFEKLRSSVVCSVGPTCSEALVANGITVDLEPEHPKMGNLVLEAAERASALLREKGGERGGAPPSENPGLTTREAGPISGSPGSVKVVSPRETRVPSPAPWRESRFMKACRLEPADATPVWLMRQAGRYMKEYRELRARVPFLELCKNPDLVAELTVTAARKIGADAAIIFADLLLIVEPLGFELEYDKGEGPIVRPALRKSADVDRMREVEPLESLSFLFDAIRKTRAELPGETPLIGFGAAPFTLASYIIEGGASKNFVHTKTLMYRDAGAWRALMEHLVRGLTGYINGQIAAGVQAVQVFDTWVGCLGPADYREYVQPYTRALIRGISPGVPLIHFGTGTAMLLEDMRDAGGDILGLDFRVELDEAWARLQNRARRKVGVQGNLDPMVLYAELPYIRRHVRRILDQAAGRPGHIFNLGHGVLPDTPFEHVVELVRMVRELSAAGKARG